jgi:hypothetical protein
MRTQCFKAVLQFLSNACPLLRTLPLTMIANAGHVWLEEAQEVSRLVEPTLAIPHLQQVCVPSPLASSARTAHRAVAGKQRGQVMQSGQDSTVPMKSSPALSVSTDAGPPYLARSLSSHLRVAAAATRLRAGHQLASGVC